MGSEKTRPEPPHSSQDEKKGMSAEEVAESAGIVLTGGHGGAIPAFIVWLTRRLFPKP